MTAGDWGDRQRSRPSYIPADWLTRQPVDIDAVKRKLEREGVFGTMVINGIEVSGPPGLMAAIADVKPLPWKQIIFGGLVLGMALWVLLA